MIKLHEHLSRDAANEALQDEGFLWNARWECWERPGTYSKAKVVHNPRDENFHIYFYQDA